MPGPVVGAPSQREGDDVQPDREDDRQEEIGFVSSRRGGPRNG